MKMVSAEGYTAFFRMLDSELLYMGRIVPRAKAITELDSFGAQWSLNIGTFPRGCFYIRAGREYVEVHGRSAIFLPPFSILELRLGPGLFEFDSVASVATLPPAVPAQPFVFDATDVEFPENVRQVARVLRAATDRRFVGLDMQAPAIARRAKAIIDETFSEHASIFEVSRRLHASHDVMGRHFKRTYGLSPVEYRNKLRVMHSLWLMTTRDYSVTDVGQAVGFNDASGFIRQFKREAKTLPSHYRN